MSLYNESFSESHTERLLELRDYFLEEESIFRGGSNGDFKTPSTGLTYDKTLSAPARMEEGCEVANPDT